MTCGRPIAVTIFFRCFDIFFAHFVTLPFNRNVLISIDFIRWTGKRGQLSSLVENVIENIILKTIEFNWKENPSHERYKLFSFDNEHFL